VILLWGAPEDAALGGVRDVLARRGVPSVFLDQRSSLGDYSFTFGGSLAGRIDGLDLDELTAAYIRPGDGSIGSDSADNRLRRSLTHHLTEWLEATSILVVNRFSAQASNMSKLYQQRLIRTYFDTPASLVTTDPDAARAFLTRHGQVIYKSLSSVRSIVKRLDSKRLEALHNIQNCPTLFQQYIAGTDYRVHVVGDLTLATMVGSDADDYRYDRAAERIAVELPEEIRRRCVALSRSLGLTFAGIDLRRSGHGTWFCFEVNPSPAYPYFEQPGRADIAEAVAELLATSTPTRAPGHGTRSGPDPCRHPNAT
jgi:glutathione synthase/RimK-type ligase-like ATP-grasp enzyme